MNAGLLRRLSVADAMSRPRREAVPAEVLAEAAPIVSDVRREGEKALRWHAERMGDLTPGAPLVRKKMELLAAFNTLPEGDRALLERTAARIRAFAQAQRKAIGDIACDVPGGRAGHRMMPVRSAGCYAPGGRFPLPSSVLMTAVTARAAGVPVVWVASPRPTPATLAAAAVAGADGLLACGGAQAIAALAYGAGEVPACDVVCGPGNRWVTAAKKIVSGDVAIDMLAGPSELVVVADGFANPAVVAADLLAQAEHDDDALPVLVSLDAGLIERVEAEINCQLEMLPSAATARKAMANGFSVAVAGLEAAVALCDRIAPEHLQLMVRDAGTAARRFSSYGALFIGSLSAEVFGDYGAGPNHVLPTGGTARFSGGLSVLTFLRVRTWLELGDPAGTVELARDAAALARIEGLEGHARAAERRLP